MKLTLKNADTKERLFQCNVQSKQLDKLDPKERHFQCNVLLKQVDQKKGHPTKY